MSKLLEEIIVAIIALTLASIIMSIGLLLIILLQPIKLLERLGKSIQKIMTL